jgi:hypothetical protein
MVISRYSSFLRRLLQRSIASLYSSTVLGRIGGPGAGACTALILDVAPNFAARRVATIALARQGTVYEPALVPPSLNKLSFNFFERPNHPR